MAREAMEYDVVIVGAGPAGLSSVTRGVIAGGEDGGSRVNTIDYVTMATAGNETDFGDLGLARAQNGNGDFFEAIKTLKNLINKLNIKCPISSDTILMNKLEIN